MIVFQLMKKIYYFILTIFRIIKYLLSNTKRYSNILLLILIYKPKSIVEIGVYKGKRSKEMIQAAKIFNNDIDYFGFDLFEFFNKSILKKELSKIPNSKKNIYKILSGIAKIKLYSGFTNKTLPLIKNKKIDFIFIDGGHSVNTIKSDWKNCKNLMRKNSICVFDDYYINDKKIIKKFGSNKIIKNISSKKYTKKICMLTDNFIHLGNNLKIKMYYVKKK